MFARRPPRDKDRNAISPLRSIDPPPTLKAECIAPAAGMKPSGDAARKEQNAASTVSRSSDKPASDSKLVTFITNPARTLTNAFRRHPQPGRYIESTATRFAESE